MRMRLCLPAVAAVALLLGADDPRKESQKDLERLQGTWQLASATQDGKPLAADKVGRTTIVFKGDKFLFPGESEQATSKDGTVKLDAAKQPRRMDATSSQGEVMLGIYELERDRYKVCFAPAGKERPAEFASKPGSGHILQVWERKKAP